MLSSQFIAAGPAGNAERRLGQPIRREATDETSIVSPKITLKPPWKTCGYYVFVNKY